MYMRADKLSSGMSAIEVGSGYGKNEQRGYERAKEKPATRAISDSPSVRSADQEREALPVASDEKGTLSIARRRKR
jgi:hypothetical protein